jgi:hypothetical protein
MKALLCVLLALTIRLSAADLAGTWTGSLTVTGPGGRAESERCLATLRQHGSRITGSVGPDRSVQWKIRNGKLVGARVTFDVLPPEGGRLRFDLRLAGDQLKGGADGENRGMTLHANVILTKTTDK